MLVKGGGCVTEVAIGYCTVVECVCVCITLGVAVLSVLCLWEVDDVVAGRVSVGLSRVPCAPCGLVVSAHVVFSIT